MPPRRTRQLKLCDRLAAFGFGHGKDMLPTLWPDDTSSSSRSRALLFRLEISSYSSAIGAFLLIDWYGLAACFPLPVILTRGDAMYSADPPLRESDLLGKVCIILRKSKRIEPRKSLRLLQRAVAALIQRSDLVARIVLRLHRIATDLLH